MTRPGSHNGCDDGNKGMHGRNYYVCVCVCVCFCFWHELKVQLQEGMMDGIIMTFFLQQASMV